MNNALKKLIIKKHSGDSAYVSLAVSFILFVIFVVTLLYMYLYSICCMNTSDNIDLLVTTYCKRMETQGCLSSGEIDDLKAELREYGVDNPEINGPGTDGTKIAYGEKVSIIVTGNLNYAESPKMADFKDFLDFLKDKFGITIGNVGGIRFVKTGTSKC